MLPYRNSDIEVRVGWGGEGECILSPEVTQADKTLENPMRFQRQKDDVIKTP